MGFQRLTRLVLLVSMSLWSNLVFAQNTSDSRISLQIITDEADAVLAILTKRKAKQSIADFDWQRLFSSEGYIRLAKRETAMRRTFTDADFKTFVLSDALLERTDALKATLARWKSGNLKRAGQLALAYLPQSARIRAKIYPEIKPRENSFVFDVNTDPAIFLYLDPKVTKEKFENTLAHELHHIGYGTGCPTPEAAKAMETAPENVRPAIGWAAAFGEGFAMLAAAGGPRIHPHAVSLADERAEWDKNVANFNSDLKVVEKFFLDVIAGSLNKEQRTEKAMSFYGVQGPWYTVGWRMAVTIEDSFGRSRLIQCMCDQRLLLPTYNEAAKRYNRRSKTPLALWSDELLSKLKI